MRSPASATVTLVLALGAAGTAVAQDEELTLRDVLPVVDAETLDADAFRALVRAGAAAAPALATAYGAATEDAEVLGRRRTRALRALRAIGPDAADAGPALVKQLATASREDVPDILRTLAETAALGPDPGKLLADASTAFAPFITPGDAGFIHRLKGAIRLHVRMSRPLPRDDVDSLVEALSAEDPYVRELAAEWLGRMGARARSAVDALERTSLATDHPKHARLPNHSLGTDFGPMIRSAAQVAIARIASDSPLAVPGLRQLLRSDDPMEQVEAAMALGRLGSREAESDLVAVLDSDDVRLVSEAVTALGMIEASSPRTVAALRALLDHEDPGVVARARASLRRAGVVVPKRG